MQLFKSQKNKRDRSFNLAYFIKCVRFTYEYIYIYMLGDCRDSSIKKEKKVNK